MGRALLVATLLVMGSSAASAQALSTLHVTVKLTDAGGKVTPVARHALLISEEPPSAPPRRIFTTLAGTADVSLRPGRYAVESDQPVAFEGRRYEWTQRIDIVAGRDATLELTADNASVVTGTAGATSATPSGTDPSFLASQWQGSVVGLWTPTQHASGFLIDARGLIVTSQRVVGSATSAEAQFTDIKVRATVLAVDPVRDVAILWINPSIVTSVRPLPLGCGQTRPAVANGQELSAIGAEMTGQKRLTFGDVTGVGPRLLLSDLTVVRASAGGPVFTAGGLIGFTTVDDRDPDSRSNARVVRIDQACEVIASAEKKITGAMSPDATPLPLDPPSVSVNALSEAVKNRAGSLSPYPMATTDFDVAFITPVHIYGAKDQARRPVMDFGDWSEYVAAYPRALFVRVTPRMVEGLWAKVARGAAMTQGISLPPMKRAKSGFLWMRAFCGDTEVAPIHPFVVEHRISESEAIYEGLYVFDPDTFGPLCATVKLTFYSEDEPDKGDTRVIDQKLLQQITRDFAPL
ncbi:MAG: trypsin-like peptidase domain-containing protein [Acidobacteria bacterium]|nr:trypsin-like peptidase domain-containing protein [Acidobacteriota bacterium]